MTTVRLHRDSSVMVAVPLHLPPMAFLMEISPRLPTEGAVVVEGGEVVV